MKRLLIPFVLIFFCNAIFARQNISITAPPSMMDTSITRLAIEDVQRLLKQACDCEVSLNNPDAEVVFVLPDFPEYYSCPPNRFQQAATVPYYPYPAHDFKWTLSQNGNKTSMTLEADCWQGVSFGLYALLQEQLGFRFYHPRESIIPQWEQFPLKAPFTFEGTALFDKKGFHLHTQHPLELTEQLHDGTIENALHDIKEYLDWLVRNGQTYFEFCLLESIDRNAWQHHAKAMTNYGHQRGLIMGIDLSLHMIQQKSFQLYKTAPKSFRGKKKQMIKNLDWLLAGGWDVLNVEFSTAEFVGGNRKKKELLRLHILAWMQENSHAKLMGRKHVVKDEMERLAKEPLVMDSAQKALDKERGILIHTVMFYDMTEPQAPVYENENLRHMFDLLLEEKEVRETWYYPESAYWITFDNSIPMFLLPYLNARLSDIDTCIKYEIPGHITFSSGWEWSYWLFDWSIARWSWQYSRNGENQKRHPLDAVELLFPEERFIYSMQQCLDLQQRMLKDSNLIQWLTAMTVTDELPLGLAQNYMPRPPHFYKDISNNIPLETIEQIRREVLPLLDTFARNSFIIGLGMKINLFPKRYPLIREWMDGVLITGLRAQHRYHTLQFLLDRREAELLKQKFDGSPLLLEAEKVRMDALKIVTERESLYRYPVALLGRKRYSHTAYQYGYLYPVSNLHFWNREERQAEQNKWSPFFMNIWDIAKIVGLKE